MLPLLMYNLANQSYILCLIIIGSDGYLLSGETGTPKNRTTPTDLSPIALFE
jgi:hypothetical protein